MARWAARIAQRSNTIRKIRLIACRPFRNLVVPNNPPSKFLKSLIVKPRAGFSSGALQSSQCKPPSIYPRLSSGSLASFWIITLHCVIFSEFDNLDICALCVLPFFFLFFLFCLFLSLSCCLAFLAQRPSPFSFLLSNSGVIPRYPYHAEVACLHCKES